MSEAQTIINNIDELLDDMEVEHEKSDISINWIGNNKVLVFLEGEEYGVFDTKDKLFD